MHTSIYNYNQYLKQWKFIQLFSQIFDNNLNHDYNSKIIIYYYTKGLWNGSLKKFIVINFDSSILR